MIGRLLRGGFMTAIYKDLITNTLGSWAEWIVD